MTHWQSARHMAHFPASSSTIGALGRRSPRASTSSHSHGPPRQPPQSLRCWLSIGSARRCTCRRLLFAGGGGGTFWHLVRGDTLHLVAARDRKLAEIGENRICDLVRPFRLTSAGLVPLFLCATVGTTQTTAVDPIGELCAVTAPHGVWVHVDAAYAGSAMVCPEFTHAIDGLEAVDSFSMNAHKWLLANNDCCAMWVKKPSALVAALGRSRI
ncbi:hypothetical protein ZWY2020_054536 [Hordeum vulgare]|nr:hypothetical protein ZWY2020_054536 [Hordeum vulgare]